MISISKTTIKKSKVYDLTLINFIHLKYSRLDNSTVSVIRQGQWWRYIKTISDSENILCAANIGEGGLLSSPDIVSRWYS